MVSVPSSNPAHLQPTSTPSPIQPRLALLRKPQISAQYNYQLQVTPRTRRDPSYRFRKRQLAPIRIFEQYARSPGLPLQASIPDPPTSRRLHFVIAALSHQTASSSDRHALPWATSRQIGMLFAPIPPSPNNSDVLYIIKTCRLTIAKDFKRLRWILPYHLHESKTKRYPRAFATSHPPSRHQTRSPSDPAPQTIDIAAPSLALSLLNPIPSFHYPGTRHHGFI